MNIQELKQLRVAKLGQCKALLASAKSLGSDNLTAIEQRSYDKAFGEAKALRKQIEIAEEEEDLQIRELGGTPGGSGLRGLDDPPGTSYSRRDTEPIIFRSAEGQEIRALRPGDRLEDSVESRRALPEGIRADELSIGRFVRGLATGDWKGSEAEHRAMSVGDVTTGGYLVPDPLSLRIIDLARNQARVLQAGAVTIPMTSNSLTIATVDTDPTAAWKAENAPFSFSDAAIGAVKLVAKTLVGGSKVSIELLNDAANIGQLVERLLSTALGQQLDLSALRGEGSAIEPTGIANHPQIQTIDKGTDGAAITNYDDFATAVEMIATVNGPSTGLSAIYTPREAGKIDRFKATDNQPLVGPASWQALRKLVTNQIPITLTKGSSTDASEAFVGDFKNLFVGMRTRVVIEVSRHASDSSGSSFKDLQVWIRAYLRADTVLVKPNYFVLIDGYVD